MSPLFGSLVDGLDKSAVIGRGTPPISDKSHTNVSAKFAGAKDGGMQDDARPGAATLSDHQMPPRSVEFHSAGSSRRIPPASRVPVSDRLTRRRMR